MKMRLSDFNPDGVTSEGNDSDMFYNYFISSKDGAEYQLFKEAHHTKEDVNKAKSYLKNNFDVLKITIITEKL